MWAAAVVAGAAVGLIVWAIVSGGVDCGKHDHLAVVSWMPVTIGKVIVMQPVYACERGAR